MRSVLKDPVLHALLAGALLAPTLLVAQQDDAAPIWEPPAFSFEGGRLDLLEAIRLTLANDPNLLLEQQDVRRQLGIFQELQGAFDLAFSGQFSWQHREQELLESVKEREREKRDDIRDAQAVACDGERDLTDKLAALRRAQGGERGVVINSDKAFEANLRILEAAIATADEATVLAELENTRRNLLATEIFETQRALNNASAACVEAGQALDRIGETPEEEEFDTGQLDLGFEKLTRSGVFWRPFLNGNYTSTEFIGKRAGFSVPFVDGNGEQQFSPSGIPLERLIDFGGKGIEDVYTFEVGFDVNIPLLRGRGRDSTGANERAAEVDYDASEKFLEFAASESVLRTVQAYWNLVAVQEQVGILERSVELQGQLLEVTQALIEAGELPQIEEARSLASEADARAQLEGASRDQAVARMDLVRAIGLSILAESEAPLANNTFPEAPEQDAVRNAFAAELISEAMGNRLDLQATRSLIDSGKILARAAVIDLRARFDVSFGISSVGRGESSLSEATSNFASPSWKVGAILERPLANNAAKGRLVQAEAQVAQRQISAADLDRNIRINVVARLGALQEALSELDYANQSAEAFIQTYEAELEKLRLGETTVIDVVLTEQQRRGALLAQLNARFRVANLLAELRFETGTLIRQGDEGNEVTFDSLTTLPGVGQ